MPDNTYRYTLYESYYHSLSVAHRYSAMFLQAGYIGPCNVLRLLRQSIHKEETIISK